MEQTDTAKEVWKPRIWGLSMPFSKAGVPVVGSFGRTIHTVVIIPIETWTRLCKEHPSLRKQEFEVGHHE